MLKKIIGTILFLCIINVTLFTQEKKGKIDFGHRMTIGAYYSYTDNNIGMMEPRYDFIVNCLYLSPDYNILDFGIGLSVIMAFDENNNVRMPTFGFATNGTMRLYSPPIRKIRLFTEGGMSFLVFTKNYPENGSKMNFALRVGGGFEYKLSDSTKLFTAMDWFHISNNDIYGRERNPSINAISINADIQF
jgi:hypothetical protein